MLTNNTLKHIFFHATIIEIIMIYIQKQIKILTISPLRFLLRLVIQLFSDFSQMGTTNLVFLRSKTMPSLKKYIKELLISTIDIKNCHLLNQVC